MSNSAALAIILPTVLLPLSSICLFIRGGRWRTLLGGSCLLLFLYGIGVLHPVIPWAFDSLRSWRLLLPEQIPGYRITLTQEPSSDFYNSHFKIQRSDNKTAFVSVDNDDNRWWFGRTKQRNGKIYFLRGTGRIDHHTSYIDPEKGVIYSGYHQTVHALAELHYKN